MQGQAVLRKHALVASSHSVLQPLQKPWRLQNILERASAGKRIGLDGIALSSVAWQATLTERALELLALPDDGKPRLLLDLGCGSGLSGEELTDRGHMWVVRSYSQVWWCTPLAWDRLGRVPR